MFNSLRFALTIKLVLATVLLFAQLIFSAASLALEQQVLIKTEQNVNVDNLLQQLKKDVLELNRDLFILKEDLLFPANTQVAVFLSLDVGTFFSLDSVNVKIDGKPVASYLYTEKQVNALVRGGTQRLYLGNIKSGMHEVVAVFTGRGPKGRDYRRATSLSFEKSTAAKYLELKIIDSTQLLQPEFSIKTWD